MVLDSQEVHEEQTIIFYLGDELYGLPITAIQEIIRLKRITPVPGADSYIEGVTNLRGRIIPVLDLRRRLGLETREPTPETRIIVIEVEGQQAGLIVDAVKEVAYFSPDSVSPPSTLASEGEFLQGVAREPDRLGGLLNLKSLLPTDDKLPKELREA